MKKIPVEAITEGMVLSRDVSGASGNILVSKATKLSTAIGKRLKNWGISSVYVEGNEEVQQEQSNITVSPEELKSGLMQKFSDVIDNPLMKQLFVAVYNYRLQKNNR